MYFDFCGKRISGVLSILPENEYKMEDEVINPDDPKVKRLKNIIGYGTRRRVKGTTTLSDMLLYGLKYLISNKKLDPEEIGAIVVATITPDYFLPHISGIIHGELGLPHEVYCIDTSQGCAGFTMGLIQAFLLLEHMTDKKVLVCTGEIQCRKSDENEPKREHPSFGGDIANITIVENTSDASNIYCSVYNDGKNRDMLIIRDGGFRQPMTAEKISKQRSNLPFMGVEMDGSGVFNFVQREVPPAVKELVSRSGHGIDDIEYFIFHQPNKFMLEKLAHALGVPKEKMPMELTTILGNSSPGTIPAVMTTFLSDPLTSKKQLCCLSGFGAGLTWGTIVMELGNYSFCENVISNL